MLKMIETMRRNWLALVAALDRIVSRFIADMEMEAMIRRVIPRYIRQGGWREVVPAGRRG